MGNGRKFQGFYVSLLLVTLILTGCGANSGTVEVDVGQAPLAAAYRVDVYAQEGGLGLVEGQYLVDAQQVTFDDVPSGRWAVFIQAQNGDLTTIGHYIGQIVVETDQVTKLMAGTYRPGLPGDALPNTEQKVDAFGPNGEAMLSAVYGPGIDSLPAAEVSLTAQSGLGETEMTESETVLSRSGVLGAQGCATAWLKGHQDVTRQTEPTPTPDRVSYGSLAPGETASFFIATTFQEKICARVLSDTQTEHCLIFAEVVDGTPILSDARALEVAQGFDQDNPFQEGSVGIYEETRARVGSEWTVNPVGGRDGDERVVLVFLSSQSIGGEGFFGFFNPQDELTQEESSNSNEGEILYINADRTNQELYDGLTTIAHEFTHLILFNQKQGQDGAFPEDAMAENTVIDEGLAVLNEELCGFGYTGVGGGNFFLLSSVSALLDAGLNRPFFRFQGGLDDYGAGYLLNRYLHDRFGVEAMRQMTTSTAVGRENIATVVGLPFADVFVDFGQAVALNGEPDLPPELSFTNLDLNGTYEDRDQQTFVLSGLQGVGSIELPGMVTNSATLEPWGTVLYRATGGDGSALTWSVEGIDSLLTGLYVLGSSADPVETPTPVPSPSPTVSP